MDVHCTTCQEPWDVFHLWHDAVSETGLGFKEAECWRQLPPSKKLTDRYRAEFKAALWEFGSSVINVIRCPCCPKDAKPDLEGMHTVRRFC